MNVRPYVHDAMTDTARTLFTRLLLDIKKHPDATGSRIKILFSWKLSRDFLHSFLTFAADRLKNTIELNNIKVGQNNSLELFSENISSKSSCMMYYVDGDLGIFKSVIDKKSLSYSVVPTTFDVSAFNDSKWLKDRFDTIYKDIDFLFMKIRALEEHAVIDKKYEYDEKNNLVRIETLSPPNDSLVTCLRDLRAIINNYKLRLVAFEKKVFPARRIHSTDPIYTQAYLGPHGLDEHQFLKSLESTVSSCTELLMQNTDAFARLTSSESSNEIYYESYLTAGIMVGRMSGLCCDYVNLLDNCHMLFTICSQLPEPKLVANATADTAKVQVISLTPAKPQIPTTVTSDCKLPLNASGAITTSVSSATANTAVSVPAPSTSPNSGSLTGVMATFGRLPAVTPIAEESTTATVTTKNTPGIATTATNG
ncbi:hypothetical protein AYO45_03485 [Gammaproteobacteria bacterium SCGC AG-212-F23]|nr:hypothetical protein AYO45_03485 [Gammaproteobacteria bacterium SCGC AG-212-F23]